jgi:hypothetical protein
VKKEASDLDSSADVNAQKFAQVEDELEAMFAGVGKRLNHLLIVVLHRNEHECSFANFRRGSSERRSKACKEAQEIHAQRK